MAVKNKIKFSAIILITAALVVVINVLYIRKIKQMLIRETKMHITQLSSQCSQAINRKLESDFLHLESLAKAETFIKSTTNQQKKQRLLEEVNLNSFVTMGYSDLNGDTVLSNGNEYNATETQFFKNSIKGNRYISDPIEYYQDGKSHKGLTFSVPVMEYGQIIGVLYGIYGDNVIKELIDINIYDNSGCLYIVKNNGTILIDLDSNRQGKSIYDFPQSAKGKDNINKLMKNINENKTGSLKLNNGDLDIFYGFSEIEGSNDWSLIVGVPTDVVFEQSFVVIRTINIITLICGIAVVISLLYLMHAKSKIEEIAFVDRLTNELNGDGLRRALRHIHKGKNYMNYLCVNLDVRQFRYINSDYGYTIGNEIINHVSRVLHENINEDEICARINADIFDIVIKNQPKKELKQRLNDIKRQCETFQTSDVIINIKVDMGVGCPHVKDIDTSNMLERANVARKYNKRNNDDQIKFFEDIDRKIEKEKVIESQIESAFDNNMFELYYQPKYDMNTNKIIGAEALIRSQLFEETNITPQTFIDVLEKTSKIRMLDRFVFEEVCKMISNRVKNNLPCVKIAINQSRKFMLTSSYMQECIHLIEKYNIDPKMIEIELTEGIIYRHVDRLIKIISELKKAGFSIAIDDFGSGFSSLSILSDLDADVIKLDKEFVGKSTKDKKSLKILTSIIDMSKNIGVDIVAEGIEEQAQVELLQKLGCHIAQGYFYDKPMPQKEFESKINNIINLP